MMDDEVIDGIENIKEFFKYHILYNEDDFFEIGRISGSEHSEKYIELKVPKVIKSRVWNFLSFHYIIINQNTKRLTLRNVDYDRNIYLNFKSNRNEKINSLLKNKIEQ